jgi:hypothetical protein
MNNVRHWIFTPDMNLDGSVTISDIGLWVNWLFTYPGDWVILKLTHSDIGRFFEFSTADYGGFLSFWISIFVFIALPFMASAFLVGREEFNENASPEEKLKDRRFWSIVQFTIFSAFVMYIATQVGETWFMVASLLMFAMSSMLLFTSNRWNK